MGSKFLKTSHNPYRVTALLLNQKKLIEQHYDFFKCTLSNEILMCRGILENKDFVFRYVIEVQCKFGNEPISKILEPESIKPSIDIHMYSDRSLCLYYPEDLKWTTRTPIYKFTIPWIVEWIYNYELYSINGGIWEGRQSPAHLTGNAN